MNEQSSQLSLIIQSAQSKNGSLIAIARDTAVLVIKWLSQVGLEDHTVERTGGRGGKATFNSLDHLRSDVDSWTEGSFELHLPSRGVSVEFSIGADTFNLICSVPLSSSGDSDLLGSFLGLARELWSALRSHALIGPVFSIRPLALEYPRPRPPRHSPIWMLGEAAYFISDEFHRSHPLGEPKALERLKSRPLKGGIVMEILEDLTIIRCHGPVDTGDGFARQRFDLEVWISSTLELPLHPEFNKEGDQRLAVRPTGDASPFTLYDSMRGIGFKAVVVSASDELDEATRRELSELVSIREFNDGRKVRQVMVIFPNRDAAIRNAEVVSKLGAAGVVYAGNDNRLWNPNPPGNWIPIDWSKV